MASLMEFQKDVETKDNVHEYLVEYLKGYMLERAFDTDEFNADEIRATGIAKEIVDKAFDNLDNMFTTKQQGKEIINEAR